NCQGLWYAGNGSAPCPAKGKHSQVGSDNYSLVRGVTHLPGESNWRRCEKCQGLSFAGSTAGQCPAGGEHGLEDRDDYTIATDATGGGQKGWRRCHKCQGMWYGLEESAGKCPADHGEHSMQESDAYQPVRVTRRIVIHIKVLTEPDIPIDRMM